MKTTKQILPTVIIGMMVLFHQSGFAQQKNIAETIVIQTSAQCEMCKDRIEKMLAYTKGIKKSNLEVKTSKLTVVYKPHKINPEKIREAISKTGYDADSIPADENAYQNLPKCCKKGGMH